MEPLYLGISSGSLMMLHRPYVNPRLNNILGTKTASISPFSRRYLSKAVATPPLAEFSLTLISGA
jgi:hypothetical protein